MIRIPRWKGSKGKRSEDLIHIYHTAQCDSIRVEIKKKSNRYNTSKSTVQKFVLQFFIPISNIFLSHYILITHPPRVTINSCKLIEIRSIFALLSLFFHRSIFHSTTHCQCGYLYCILSFINFLFCCNNGKKILSKLWTLVLISRSIWFVKRISYKWLGTLSPFAIRRMEAFTRIVKNW